MKYCPQCQQSYPKHERVCPADGALLSLPDPYHLVGKTIVEKYRLDALIGVGGMGAVYCARHLRIDRRVAVKILLPNLALGNERVVELFEREAKTAGRLHHENIANVMDAGRTPEGLAYIAMEWIEGETLQDELLAQGQFSFERAAGILRQIAAALDLAHEQNIIHRDLKPANVMLVKCAGGEQVKVLDFGIAKIAGDTAAATISAPMGTPHYASPEQFRSGGQIDWRSDIYSLGVILYQMLTGAPPFDAASVPELIKLQMTAPPPPIRKLRPETPIAVEQLISRLLAKDPGQRPQRAADIPALFDRALASAGKSLADTAGIESQATGDWAVSDDTEVRFSPPTIRAQTRPTAAPVAKAERRGLLSRRKALVVAAILLTAISAFLTWRFIRSTPPDRPPRVIAVLPFKPLVADGRDEWLEMGMAETLIEKLSSLRQAQVPPLSAVRRYTRLDQDAVAAGRELQADAVLEGSIQKAVDQKAVGRGMADRVRITVRLVRVADGTQLWAEKFDESLADVFILQDAIARKVTDALALGLTGAERQRLAKHDTINVEAYQLYLEGRLQWQKRTRYGLTKAIEYFQQALDKDPNYVPAYSGIASSYSLLVILGFLPPRFAMPKAEEMAKRALTLNESSAEAHAALAVVRAQYDWNWAEADRELELAIRLDPNLAEAHQYFALVLAARGHLAEARDELRLARQLDPNSLPISSAEGWVNYLARDYDRVIAQSKELIASIPNFPPAQQNLGQALAAKGMIEAALPALLRARELSGNSATPTARLGNAYARLGRKKEAQQLLDELKEGANREFGVAWVYLGLGDKDAAFEWLGRAVNDRAAEMAYLKMEPLYDSLRGDPRFDDLLRRVGLMQ